MTYKFKELNDITTTGTNLIEILMVPFNLIYGIFYSSLGECILIWIAWYKCILSEREKEKEISNEIVSF